MVTHGVPGIKHPLEVVETVLEVADLAWNAVEHHRKAAAESRHSPDAEEVDCLRSENLRLRALLVENLHLLQDLSGSPALATDCPPDLYSRLEAVVDSSKFLGQLEHQKSTMTPNNFPFSKATGADLHLVEVLINADQDKPSLWVWVTHEMVPSTAEELSGIDDESYVIVDTDQVVDGIANFVARCIISNPNAQKLSPEELHKTVASALGGMSKWEKFEKLWHAGKIIYALSTWGLALAGLYRHRAVFKAAAKGIGATSKVVLKAL
ncbi:hypothetical protein H6P81_011044 [Aristolochia fimbriata]|uniref:Uncharacterized protein n=1 Tax=Aristolochia fimbriata TaxID=158543 RepID=A0AAV7ER55_ARIFI|nr:hypothetical protein H6P81_011044 [Aristolochia fimbriata]